MKYSSSSPKSADESAELEKIIAQRKLLEDKFVSGLIDSVPHVSLVLNTDRKIVLYNKALEAMVDESLDGQLIGSRLGELLHCGNSVDYRCGESNACSLCGCMQAMMIALGGEVGSEECTLLTDRDGMVNSHIFRVTAAPLVVGEEHFAIVYLTDISDHKNKEIVEKIFLHDLMNAVNGIASAGSLLHEEIADDSSRQLADMIVERARFMANEINAHRLFISAEKRQLEISREEVSVQSIVESICMFFSGSQLAKDKRVEIVSGSNDFHIVTDKRILYRILENLVKNAVEASPESGRVVVSAVQENGSVIFTVNNEGVVPITVASQIYKRSYSTKGKGRGLGTYSVKMFTENYLQGRAWFDSSFDEGTNFYVQLPLFLGDSES